MVDKAYQAARRTHIADLLKNVLERTTGYAGATIVEAPNNALRIKVVKSVTDLNRFKRLSFATEYLY